MQNKQVNFIVLGYEYSCSVLPGDKLIDVLRRDGERFEIPHYTNVDTLEFKDSNGLELPEFAPVYNESMVYITIPAGVGG